MSTERNILLNDKTSIFSRLPKREEISLFDEKYIPILLELLNICIALKKIMFREIELKVIALTEFCDLTSNQRSLPGKLSLVVMLVRSIHNV